MDANEIQVALAALSDAMLAKALPTPKARLSFEANSQVCSGIEWGNKSRPYGTEYHYFRDDTPEAALAQAQEYVAALPGAEQRNLEEFMGLLGSVIDLGRERGIEADFVNPLVETMRRLSENALTHQKVAAE